MVERIEKVPTGIEGFDKVLKGGFVKNSVNLISGSSGTGKTLFGVSFIYYGAVKYGEKGVYITLEEPKDRVVLNCSAIGLDLNSVDTNLFKFHDLASERGSFSADTELSPSSKNPIIMDNLLKYIRLYFGDAKRLVLDSVVPLNLVCKDLKEFRSNLFRFSMGLRKSGITCIFTTEVPYNSDDTSRFDIEDFVADSVTKLIATDKGNQLKVHKMRGSDFVRGNVDYNITKDGIKVLF